MLFDRFYDILVEFRKEIIQYLSLRLLQGPLRLLINPLMVLLGMASVLRHIFLIPGAIQVKLSSSILPQQRFEFLWPDLSLIGQEMVEFPVIILIGRTIRTGRLFHGIDTFRRLVGGR